MNSDITTTQIAPVRHSVGAEDRRARYRHRGAVIWLTGLSGSGKSTLAMELECRLLGAGYACYALDGDNIRHGLNSDLGFSPEDRRENIRRVGEVAALFADAGLVCIAAFIAPYRADRAFARNCLQHGNFYEVYLSADISVCEARDPKGYYRRARAGEIKDFTGIDAPYELPEQPDLTIDTGRESIETCLNQLQLFIEERNPIHAAALAYSP